MTHACSRLLSAAIIAIVVSPLAPAPASADELVDVSLAQVPGGFLTPMRPAEPRGATSEGPGGGECVGLKDYEIIRSTTATAQCSPGNKLLSGFCASSLGPGQGPSLDGTAWECIQGPSFAICAAVCSELSPATGACCTGEECSVSSAQDCGAAGGEYLGDGTPCDGAACAPTGACCVPEVPCCLDGLTEDECALQEGDFLVDQDCDSDDAQLICFDGCPPPNGACCFDGGTGCDVVASQEECEAAFADGEYQGDGTDCADPDICGLPPTTGACCIEGGCIDDFEQAECESSGGEWQGAGSLCELLTCEFATGACCGESGQCSDGFTEVDCNFAGVYAGDDTTCDDVPPPCPGVGACCDTEKLTCQDGLPEVSCGGDWYEGLTCDDDEVLANCETKEEAPVPRPPKRGSVPQR